MPGQLQKKPLQRKPLPLDKKNSQPKSPSVKRQKEIQYVKLCVIQQQFKTSDIKQMMEMKEEELDIAVPKVERLEQNDDEQEGEEQKKDEEEEVPEPDERGEEAHDEYVPSDEEQVPDETPIYDPTDKKPIEVNMKNKARSLKKVILDSLDMGKKANIILLKEDNSKNHDKELRSSNWVQFTEKDYDTPVKYLHGVTIAFKVYMEVSVSIDGRGQSYKTQLQVDPKERLEDTLAQRTHFWKTFMTRGAQKCFCTMQRKTDEEEKIINPNCYNKTFQELDVEHGTKITLFEIKNYQEFDSADEGGEDENEEMEAEQEEQEDPEEPEDQAAEDEKPSEKDQKASEVLFENDEDKNKVEKEE